MPVRERLLHKGLVVIQEALLDELRVISHLNVDFVIVAPLLRFSPPSTPYAQEHSRVVQWIMYSALLPQANRSDRIDDPLQVTAIAEGELQLSADVINVEYFANLPDKRGLIFVPIAA
jgi:hypothetical protein